MMTFNFKTEKAKRSKQIEDFCEGMKGLPFDENNKIHLKVLLEVAMDDAYACGRIEKEAELKLNRINES